MCFFVNRRCTSCFIVMCFYVCMYIHLSLSLYIYMCMYIYTHMMRENGRGRVLRDVALPALLARAPSTTGMCVYIYIYIYIHMYVYVCMYVCLYIYIYIYIHIYTYTHIMYMYNTCILARAPSTSVFTPTLPREGAEVLIITIIIVVVRIVRIVRIVRMINNNSNNSNRKNRKNRKISFHAHLAPRGGQRS